MESRNGSGGAAAATAESVEKFGISMTVLGNRGVTVDTAATRTGEPAPRDRAKSIDDSTRAAAPSDVAQISSSRKGSATIGELSTSSSVTSLRYRAYGLFRPCLAFLTLTRAKSESLAP